MRPRPFFLDERDGQNPDRPALKRQAEAVLKEIGLPPRVALELFYKQIILRRAIPFPVPSECPEDQFLSSPTRRNAIAEEF
jgi:DNA-damage-inducible protein J